jgi:hypothetical protein
VLGQGSPSHELHGPALPGRRSTRCAVRGRMEGHVRHRRDGDDVWCVCECACVCECGWVRWFVRMHLCDQWERPLFCVDVCIAAILVVAVSWYDKIPPMVGLCWSR